MLCSGHCGHESLAPWSPKSYNKYCGDSGGGAAAARRRMRIKRAYLWARTTRSLGGGSDIGGQLGGRYNYLPSLTLSLSHGVYSQSVRGQLKGNPRILVSLDPTAQNFPQRQAKCHGLRSAAIGNVVRTSTFPLRSFGGVCSPFGFASTSSTSSPSRSSQPSSSSSSSRRPSRTSLSAVILLLRAHSRAISHQGRRRRQRRRPSEPRKGRLADS